MSEGTQVVSAPESTDRKSIEPLGYVESRDGIANRDYAYAAYRETDTASGQWKLMIKAAGTAGAALDPEHPSVRRNISKAAVAGEDHVVFGFELASSEADARLVENRLYFDSELVPTRVEMHLVTRNPDGSPTEEQVAKFDWPGEPVEEKQLLSLPKSSDRKKITQLAYLSSYDVMIDKDYAYLAYKEEDTASGKWALKITGKSTAGCNLDPSHSSFQKNIETAAAQGADHLLIGFNLKTDEGDERVVENRLYFDDDRKATRVEIHVVTRRADGSAKDPVSASFDWPE